MAGVPIRATARSSTACARRGGCPRRPIIATGRRAGSPAYGTNAQAEDQWHLPDGRTLHVVADSEGEAGVTYLYENVTERLALESRYNALIEVQTGDARHVARGRRRVRAERPLAPL